MGNEERIKNIKDLRKEFPSNEYFLCRRNTPIVSVFRFKLGAYEVAIFSPNHKGDRQPVEYYKLKNDVIKMNNKESNLVKDQQCAKTHCTSCGYNQNGVCTWKNIKKKFDASAYKQKVDDGETK